MPGGGAVEGEQPRNLAKTAMTVAATALAVAAVVVGAVWAVVAIVDDDAFEAAPGSWPGPAPMAEFGEVYWGPYSESLPGRMFGEGVPGPRGFAFDKFDRGRRERAERYGAERDPKRDGWTRDEWTEAPKRRDKGRGPDGRDKGDGRGRGARSHSEESCEPILSLGEGSDGLTLLLCTGRGAASGDRGDQGALGEELGDLLGDLLDDLFGLDGSAPLPFLSAPFLGLESIPDFDGGELPDDWFEEWGLGGGPGFDGGESDSGGWDLDGTPVVPGDPFDGGGVGRGFCISRDGDELCFSEDGEWLSGWLEEWGLGGGPLFDGGEFGGEWLEEWARRGGPSFDGGTWSFRGIPFGDSPFEGSPFDGGGASGRFCFSEDGEQFCFDFGAGSENGSSEESEGSQESGEFEEQGAQTGASAST